MTLAGWFTMILSVGSVTGLFVYCVWRVLNGRPGHELGHVEPIHADQIDER
jgi:hypothetical protein